MQIKKYVRILSLIVTLFVLFACKSNVEFTITFDSNGGSQVESIVSNGSATIRMPDDPVKEGHVFAGWYWDNSTFRELFTISSLSERGLTSNLTVYAKWMLEEDYIPIGSIKVTFDSKGGTDIAPVYVMPGRTILIPTVSKKGHTLDGWYTSLNDGDTLDERWSFTNNIVNNNLTLYAKWIVNQYTITFDSKEGSSVANITQEYNTEISEPAKPVKDGHLFRGWFIDEELTIMYNFKTMQAENITLYAKWIIPYTIEFVGFNNISLSIEIYEVGSDLLNAIVPMPPNIAGYRFIKWDTELPLIMPSQNIVIKAEYAIYLEYKINDNNVEITGLIDNDMKNVVIPSSINDIPVTKIGREAFANASSLTSITIPSCIIDIEDLAFSGATSLMTVVFQEGSQLNNIGYGAFLNASSLTNIQIPSYVTKIGERAFFGASSLTNINVIGYNLHYSSEDGVLFNKDKTTLVKYPEGKTDSTYMMPSSVLAIGDSAFSGTTSLTIVTFDENSNLKIIGNRAFNSTTFLSKINIPSTVTDIGDYAFSHTTSLTSISFEENSQLLSIGEGAFSNSAISSMNIPSNVSSIPQGLFRLSTSLINVSIPSKVIVIGDYAFSGTTSLERIDVNDDNQNYSSVDGVLFNKDKTTLLKYPESKTDSIYMIPSSVLVIGENAFNATKYLTTITFEEDSKLTNISNGAFRENTTLVSISIPSSVTSIGASAFFGATSLVIIKIETDSSLTNIGDRAFSFARSLTSIFIPKSVVSIGEYAFRSTDSLTIYAEVSSKPVGWHDSWNHSNRPVLWGYTS